MYLAFYEDAWNTKPGLKEYVVYSYEKKDDIDVSITRDSNLYVLFDKVEVKDKETLWIFKKFLVSKNVIRINTAELVSVIDDLMRCDIALSFWGWLNKHF